MLRYLVAVVTGIVMAGMSVGLYLCWRLDQAITPHIEPWSHLFVFGVVWFLLCVFVPIFVGLLILDYFEIEP